MQSELTLAACKAAYEFINDSLSCEADCECCVSLLRKQLREAIDAPEFDNHDSASDEYTAIRNADAEQDE